MSTSFNGVVLYTLREVDAYFAYTERETMSYLDEFVQWLKDHPNHEPLPQAIAEVYNMGFGSDDPNWQGLVESWKKRHEEQCDCPK